MTGWQIALLSAAVLCGALAGIAALAVPGETGTAMPLAVLVFWPAAGFAVLCAAVFALTFVF